MYKIALEEVEKLANKMLMDCKKFSADKGYNELWVISRCGAYLSAQLWAHEKRENKERKK